MPDPGAEIVRSQMETVNPVELTEVRNAISTFPPDCAVTTTLGDEIGAAKFIVPEFVIRAVPESITGGGPPRQSISHSGGGPTDTHFQVTPLKV